MQLRTTLLSTLLVSLFIASSTSAAVAPPSAGPRSDSSHKFSKREPAPEPRSVHHYHHYDSPAPAARSGGFGSGGALKTIATGTVLAGTGAFAATGGSIAAHNLFDSHDDHREGGERRGGGGDDERGSGRGDGGGEAGGSGGNGGGYQQRVAPMPQQQTSGTAMPSFQGLGVGGPLRPIAVLMSDGSFQTLQDQGLPAYRQTAPVSAGAGAGYGAGAGVGAGAGSGGGFVFPQSK